MADIQMTDAGIEVEEVSYDEYQKARRGGPLVWRPQGYLSNANKPASPKHKFIAYFATEGRYYRSIQGMTPGEFVATQLWQLRVVSSTTPVLPFKPRRR